MTLAYLPSPSQGVWHLGPVPIRAYALCMLAGVVLAVVVGDRRWRARGGRPGTVADVATVVVPAGFVGARLYHVLTSPAAYLEEPVRVLYVWQGGLGIPGGVLAATLCGYGLCRRRGIAPGALADAVAPGVALAQAVARFGNWFNQELFGRPTTLPWGLQIDPEHRPARYADAATFHPAFLYEAAWNVGVAGAVLWADRRFRLGYGRAFALYLALYAVGRMWIEALRVDEAAVFLGLRLNVWVMLTVFVGTVAYLVARRGQGRETHVELPDPDADTPHDQRAARARVAARSGRPAERRPGAPPGHRLQPRPRPGRRPSERQRRRGLRRLTRRPPPERPAPAQAPATMDQPQSWPRRAWPDA